MRSSSALATWDLTVVDGVGFTWNVESLPGHHSLSAKSMNDQIVNLVQTAGLLSGSISMKDTSGTRGVVLSCTVVFHVEQD